MRKIAHVISTPEGIGGAERIMLALLRGGGERKWNQVVLNPFDLDPDGSRLRAEVAETEGVDYSARATTRATQLPSARSWLRARLVEFDPAIVHVHLFHALVLTASLRRSSRLTIVSHHHGDQLRVAGDRVRESVDRWAGKRMDHVVACSRWVHDFLVDGYGYPAERVTEIPNGWEGDPRKPVPSGSDGCAFICVANLRPEKDHVTLLEAFDVLRGRHPSVRLLLVGDGPTRKEIERMIESRGLQDAVQLYGSSGDVWPLLSRSDVFVLPSRNETLGMAALEAMAASLPVVATAVGGIPELVEHGQNGLLVPPRRAEALADAMSALVESPEDRHRMGTSGRVRAQSRKMDVTVNRYFELYERLLAH